MKIRTISYLFAFVLLFYTHSASQSLVETSPTISVSGKAELFVEPDFVTFRLEVTKENLNLEAATGETESVVKKIQAIARKHGLKSEDISTKSITVDKKYRFVQNKDNRILDEDGDEIGKREFIGYEASTLIIIRVNELAKFQALFAELLTSGVDEIDDVNFQTTRLREVKDKARDLAIIAAREKAAAMAKAVGQTIGKAIKITEGTNRSSYSFNSNISSNNTMSFESPGERGGAIITSSSSGYSPGVISVDAEVSVTFLLN